jgi:phage terminase large subunit GpA-like protein
LYHSKINIKQRNLLDLLITLRLALKPREHKLISQWAAAERKLCKEETSRPGPWDNELAPFAVPVMDAFVDPEVEKVTVMSSAQLVKTEAIKNVIGYYIDHDPCPMLYVSPTDTTSKDFSKEKLAPMINYNSNLRDKVGRVKHRNSDATSHKQFPGGYLSLVGSNSPNQLAQRSVKIVLVDDSDRCPAETGDEGDPVKLAEERTESYSLLGRKIGQFSTPTIEGQSRIEAAYLKSDQGKWYVPCPYCAELQPLEFENLKWKSDKDLYGRTTKHYPETVKLQCIHCEELIEERHKHWMLNNGKRIAKHPERKKHFGISLNRLYSQMSTWEQVVIKFLDAKDNLEELRVFYNTVLGKTWKLEQSASFNADKLLERCEDYLTKNNPHIPKGVLLLTAAVDVQGDRLECEVKGWGIDYENWSIGIEKFFGDPNLDDVWEDLFNFIDHTTFVRKDGLELKVKICAVDSGDKSQSVYEAIRERHPKYIAVKGGNESDRPMLPRRPSKVDNNRTYLYVLGVNAAKTKIFDGLKIKKEGSGSHPGYWHFSKEFNDYEYFKQLTAEKMVVKHSARGPKITWEKKKKGARNEALDLNVYNLAAINLINPDFHMIHKNQQKQLEENKEDRESKVKTISSAKTKIVRSTKSANYVNNWNEW